MSIIKDCLRRTQPPKYYRTDPGNDSHVVQLISQVLVDKSRRDQTMIIPEIVSDVSNCGKEIKHRCGRLFESSFLADEGSLFYDYIYCTTYPSHKKYLTSFGVKRNIFHAFFGTIPDEFRHLKCHEARVLRQFPSDRYRVTVHISQNAKKGVDHVYSKRV